MPKRSILLLPFLVFTACNQTSQSPQIEAVAPRGSVVSEKPEPDPKPVFADLNKLCHALDGAGLPTGGLWKKIPDWDYQCISSYRDFGPDAPLRSNIAYYVSGKSATRADEVKIVLNINVRGSEAASRTLLFATASQWFQSFDIPMPTDLTAAIRSNRRFEGAAGNYKLEYWSEQNGKVLEKHLKIT